MSEQQLPSTSTFVEAMDDINKTEKLNPKAEQLLVDMGINKDESLPTCTITQEKIDYKDCVKTSCGHYFSCEEFWEWTKQSNKCPNCREELIKRDRSEELALKNLLDRRREIREQVREAYEELDIIKRKMADTQATIKLKKKCVKELLKEEDELIDSTVEMERKLESNREILDEMRLYNTNRSEWKKRMKRRERLAIHRGKERWRNKMKIVHKELFSDSWIEDEEGLKQELDPYYDEIDISEINMFDLPQEFAGNENRLSTCTYSEWTENGNLIGNLRPVLEEGDVDEINWDSYPRPSEWTNEEADSNSDMSIVNSDIDDMPELVELPIETPPQSPREPTSPPPVERVSNWRNRSLNPRQFREFLNSLQSINIHSINDNNDIVAHSTFIQHLFDTELMNPSHPDD